VSSIPPVPSDEVQRLAALDALGMLDTPPEPAFDRITRIASELFHVPIALVSLVDKDRQWFKSCVGLDVRETPRQMAFCAHAIMRDDVLVVPDARADERFATNPLVAGPPHIRFYAGAPLITRDGFRLGTLCIIDTRPRPVMSPSHKQLLKDFAGLVVDAMEARRPSGQAHPHQAQAEAAAANAAAAKSEFLAMVSHELRTPLNAILGFSAFIKDETFGPVGNPQYRDQAQVIHESGQHLLSMIDTILDFASAEKGEIRMQETEFSVREVVDQALRLLSEKARRLGVVTGAVPVDSHLMLTGDRKHVLEMLLKVIGNAIKFNRPGGNAVARCELDEEGGLHIYITDNGIGIAPDLIDRLLTPFSQIDGRLARSHEGIGLGLAITRRFLELHGGTLSIQGLPGEGTCVVLNFPPTRVRVRPSSSAA